MKLHDIQNWNRMSRAPLTNAPFGSNEAIHEKTFNLQA